MELTLSEVRVREKVEDGETYPRDKVESMARKGINTVVQYRGHKDAVGEGWGCQEHQVKGCWRRPLLS